jgi:predicted RNase H-like HicB family nuclease
MQLTVEFDREMDGRHIAEVPQLPGCLAYGRTREEADVRVRVLALRILADDVERGSLQTKDIEDLSFDTTDIPTRRSSFSEAAHVPNAKTVAAMREPRNGPRFSSVEELLADLHAED